MSYLCYNNIVLEVVKTNRVEMNPEFSEDGIDFLWTHVVIDIDAIINPKFSSFYIDANGCLNFNVAQQNNLTVGPFQSTQSIRQYLMTPRGTLVFSEVSLGYRFLQSPAPGFDIDSNGGPKPISFSVIKIDGFRTFHVRYSIETWINECPVLPSPAGPIPIVSNRFTVSHSIDQQYLLNKTTTGTAIFRTDILRGSVANPGVQYPDYWRESLIPPLSQGLQRVQCDISVNTKGNVLTWTVRDVEKTYDLGDPNDPNSFTASGITSMDAGLSMTTFGTDGAANYGTVAIFQANARGQYLCYNWNMFVALWKMAAIYLRPPGVQIKGLIKNIQVASSVTDASVSLTVNYWIPPTPFGKDGLAVPLDLLKLNRVGGPPGNPRLNPSPPLGNAIGSLNEGIPVRTMLIDSIRKCMVLGEQLNFLYAEGSIPTDILNAPGGVGSATAARLQCVSTVPGVPDTGFFAPSTGSQYGSLVQPAVNININQDIPVTPSHYLPTMQSVPISHYKINSNYQKDTGRRQLSTAGDTSATPEVVRIASPQSTLTIDWTAEATYDTPTIPDPVINDKNLYLMESEVEPQGMELLPDQSGVAIRVSGRYTYLAKNPVGAGDVISLTCPPWFDVGFGFKMIKASDYQHGIIDDINGSQGNV